MDVLINKEQAIDKIKKRLFETAFNNVGVKQDIDETLADVAENRLENWFGELPSVQPDTTTHDSIPAETGENDGDRTRGDCISRQQAINKIKPWLEVKGYGWGELNLLRAVINELENMPTIQPDQRWIPVEERLPDDLAEVNVTWINHEPEPYYDFVKDKPFTASAVYYKGDWYWYSSVCVDILAEYGKNEIDKLDDAIEITAWKPLPEPYQGGD